MNGPYLLFAGIGDGRRVQGWFSYQGCFESIDEAKVYFDERSFSWGHIVDLSLEVIIEYFEGA